MVFPVRAPRINSALPHSDTRIQTGVGRSSELEGESLRKSSIGLSRKRSFSLAIFLASYRVVFGPRVLEE